MTTDRGLRLAVAWTFAVVMLGCSAGSVPQDHFYRLNVSAPQKSNPSTPRYHGVLTVERLAGDGPISERAVLYTRNDGSELQQHHYHYWIEPPPLMIQEQLVADLKERGAATTVVTPEMRIQPDYVITGRIKRFERVMQNGTDRVVVEVRLTLTEVGENRLVWNETYRVETPVEGEGVNAAVRAFNRGVSELVGRLADDISRVEAES